MYKEIINKMFEIAGHDVTYDDVINRKDDWFLDYTMTTEQQKQWIEWGVDFIRKKTRTSKQRAEMAMQWIVLDHSLMLKDC